MPIWKKVFKSDKLWIVSYYDYDGDIFVTAFDNKEAAENCYTFFKNEKGVCECALDECPIYKHFIIAD